MTETTLAHPTTPPAQRRPAAPAGPRETRFTRAVDTVDWGLRVYMRLRTWLAPTAVGVTARGIKLHCHTRDFIQRRVFFFHVYEPNLTHYLAERLAPGDLFVDVGANVGYMALTAAQIVGAAGGVFAIEASPQTHASLMANVALNDAANVETLNVAATGEPGFVDILEGEAGNIGSASIRPVSGPTPASVRGDRLTSLLAERCALAGFIKIDVEGSEGPILRDILDHLDRFQRLSTLAVELSPKNAGYFGQLVAAGFRAYALPNNYRIGYLLVRQYLARSGEGDFVVKLPASAYDPRFTDYVFER